MKKLKIYLKETKNKKGESENYIKRHREEVTEKLDTKEMIPEEVGKEKDIWEGGRKDIGKGTRDKTWRDW